MKASIFIATYNKREMPIIDCNSEEMFVRYAAGGEELLGNKRFLVTKRYIKMTVNGTLLQSDSLPSPLEEWEEVKEMEE